MKKRNKQLVIGLGAVSALGAGLALASMGPQSTLYGPPPGEEISTENPAAEDTAVNTGTTEITEVNDTGSTAASDEIAEELIERPDPDTAEFDEAQVPALMYGPPSYFNIDPDGDESEEDEFEERSDSGTDTKTDTETVSETVSNSGAYEPSSVTLSEGTHVPHVVPPVDMAASNLPEIIYGPPGIAGLTALIGGLGEKRRKKKKKDSSGQEDGSRQRKRRKPDEREREHRTDGDHTGTD